MIDVKIEYNHTCKEVEYIDGEYFRKFVTNDKLYFVETDIFDEITLGYKFEYVLGKDLLEFQILKLLITEKL